MGMIRVMNIYFMMIQKAPTNNEINEEGGKFWTLGIMKYIIGSMYNSISSSDL